MSESNTAYTDSISSFIRAAKATIVGESESSSETIACPTNRRIFLQRSLTTTIAASVLGACANGDNKSAPAQSVAAKPAGTDSDHSGGSMAAHPATAASAAATVQASADAMDAMHEKGMKEFPAKTAVKGGQRMEPRIENGVKVFELTAREIKWEVTPGKFVQAWAYNDMVPGPEIRVKEGDKVRVVLKNELKESTVIHFHGLELPIALDGVPFITQPPVKPGQSYTYEFVVPNAGSHMYHSHHNSAKQVGLGLLGAFIVEPKKPRAIEKVDVDYTMVLNDGAHGYTLNGKGFPATEPIVAKLGQKVRIRYMNEGMMIHPMHLHGMHMTVIDKDGWPQPAPWKCDTLNIAPGERWDVIVNCNNPGTWAFHCHILPHAETEHGMFGMVTALVVQ
ncbi:MAG: multicopper oxidase family protein [Gemmatimonas sp.]